MRKLILAIILCVPLFSLRAQPIGVHEGHRVRITSMSNKDIIGTVSRAGADSVVIFTEPDGLKLAIATSEVRRLALSRGRSAAQGAERGAMWGAAVGTGLGLLFANAYQDNTGNSRNSAVPAVTSVAVSGLVWGGVIGVFVKAERWNRIR